MFKGNRKYYFVLGTCFVALILIKVLAPRPIDWRPNYSKKAKLPYGTSALYSLLPELFHGKEIRESYQPAYNTLFEKSYSGSNYMLINDAFKPDKLDSRELLKYVDEGNTLFIAANYFSGQFADTLHLKTENFLAPGTTQLQDSSFQSLLNPKDSIVLQYKNPLLSGSKKFIYTKGVGNTFFSNYDSTRATIIGTNTDGGINFLKFNWGKGQIFVSCLPEVFSNYQFVHPVNKNYVYIALSYLPDQQVIWDEYYKAGNTKQDTPMRVILNNPALRSAYYLLMLCILVFMLIGIKRKQRIVPVILPYQNTSLQFVEVIGSLYYQQGDHKNIADKKIRFFLEQLRTHFQVNTQQFNETFLERIHQLSGIERSKIDVLFRFIAQVQTNKTIKQEELLKLNKLLEDFQHNNKR